MGVEPTPSLVTSGLAQPLLASRWDGLLRLRYGSVRPPSHASRERRRGAGPGLRADAGSRPCEAHHRAASGEQRPRPHHEQPHLRVVWEAVAPSRAAWAQTDWSRKAWPHLSLAYLYLPLSPVP